MLTRTKDLQPPVSATSGARFGTDRRSEWADRAGQISQETSPGVVRFREELRRAEARYFAWQAKKRAEGRVRGVSRSQAAKWQAEAVEWSKELR